MDRFFQVKKENSAHIARMLHYKHHKTCNIRLSLYCRTTTLEIPKVSHLIFAGRSVQEENRKSIFNLKEKIRQRMDKYYYISRKHPTLLRITNITPSAQFDVFLWKRCYSSNILRN